MNWVEESKMSVLLSGLRARPEGCSRDERMEDGEKDAGREPERLKAEGTQALCVCSVSV